MSGAASDPVRSTEAGRMTARPRFPSPDRSRRGVWWLIAAYCVLLVANVAGWAAETPVEHQDEEPT